MNFEYSHADRRTDMTELVVPFRNFANAPKSNNKHNVLPYRNTWCTSEAEIWRWEAKSDISDHGYVQV